MFAVESSWNSSSVGDQLNSSLFGNSQQQQQQQQQHDTDSRQADKKLMKKASKIHECAIKETKLPKPTNKKLIINDNVDNTPQEGSKTNRKHKHEDSPNKKTSKKLKIKVDKVDHEEKTVPVRGKVKKKRNQETESKSPELEDVSVEDKKTKKKKKTRSRNKYSHLAGLTREEKCEKILHGELPSQIVPSLKINITKNKQQDTAAAAAAAVAAGESGGGVIKKAKKRKNNTKSVEEISEKNRKQDQPKQDQAKQDLPKQNEITQNKTKQNQPKNQNLSKLKQETHSKTGDISKTTTVSITKKDLKKKEKQKDKKAKDSTEDSKKQQTNQAQVKKILKLVKQPEPIESDDNEEDSGLDESEDDIPVTAGKRGKKVLPLRERMIDRLQTARFRYLNEQLYTCTGSEAFEMFKNDPQSFEVYHTGYQTQVEKWPKNPQDDMIKYIKSKPSSFVIGDFGCGEAQIAQSVKNTVHSFDLVKVNEHITPCDMSKVPLDDETVDVVIFCLSLMGTNLADFLIEARRVLKPGGSMRIAEVISRFENVHKFCINVESLGFTTVSQDTSNKMFVILEFKKTEISGKTKSRINKTPPNISLLPCLYKKR
ncbi:uncharacterized protein LOC141905519 isoform X2 [Tubulanus polymorphus]|uniref:uncharacterized protein LOC141905519 isoform X2 n=1 Tax=Tubulanus polymorphus TaxID=672921 RepID=UPI003DA41288